MNSKIVSILFLITLVQSKIGDRIPFCHFPEKFDTTVQPVTKKVDIKKFEGTWYEIARNMTASQINCICSKAEYSYNHLYLYMKMRNSCITKNGGENVQELTAVTQNIYNSFWKVMYLPFIGGNYFIIEMDPELKWIVVGNPCRTNFWILSKDKSMKQSCVRDRLVNLQRLGFCTKRVVYRSETCKEKQAEVA